VLQQDDDGTELVTFSNVWLYQSRRLSGGFQMFALLAAVTLAGLSGVPVAASINGPVAESPQLRITINGNGDYRPGERVRVQVESAEDGYLIVFRVDGDGRIRVVFPLDPDLDPFVRGGKRYELRGRGERETFLADDRSGNGMLYAALSRDPLNMGRFASGDHWDYGTLRLSEWDADAEAELTQVVKEMAGSGRFTYDVLSYRVHGDVYISGGAGIVAPSNYGYRDPFYDPYWSCLACGYGIARPGVNIRIGSGFGWYDPWDPWFYDPWGYRYGYRSGWYDPWGWNYPGQNWPITVINLPRPQIPNTAYGYRARPRTAPVAGSLAPDLGRAMRPQPTSDAGRAPNDGRSRSRPVEPTRTTRPAEPQRPERGSQPPSTPPSGRQGSGTQSSPPPASSGGSTGQGTRARPRPAEQAIAPSQVAAPQMERRGDGPPAVVPVVVPPRREAEPQRAYVSPGDPLSPERTRSRRDDRGGRDEPQRAEPSRSQPVYREPPRNEPQRSEPRRAEPVRQEPQRSEPRRAEPVRQEPQRSAPPSSPPPRSEPVIRSAPPSSPPPSAPPASSGRARRP
jgi:hypothetical protein